MEIRTIIALPVTEPSQVAEARRFGAALARSLNFDDLDTGKVAILTTELATNLVKHARDGELVLNALEDSSDVGVEIIALDRGPGMANPVECLRDGYSTVGGAGTGLGAVTRSASMFDIYSVPGLGTAVLARLWRTSVPGKPPRHRLHVGGLCVARNREEVCGDRWAFRRHQAHHLTLVADGLGHGLEAAEASIQAVKTFESTSALAPAAILEVMHPALRHTRGAAVAVADIDLGEQVLRFAGVGNISAGILGARGNHQMVSHNGTLGHEVRKIQEFHYPWPERGLLIMHSDGLSQRSDPDSYPGLPARHPGLIAGVLYRDFRRANDDATIVALKDMGEA